MHAKVILGQWVYDICSYSEHVSLFPFSLSKDVFASAEAYSACPLTCVRVEDGFNLCLHF